MSYVGWDGGERIDILRRNGKKENERSSGNREKKKKGLAGKQG